jgi:hypothetical protein
MRSTLLALLAIPLLACDTDPLGPLPAELPLSCGADPISSPQLVAEGQINIRSTGPCGDIIYQSFAAGVSSQILVSPGQEPFTLVGQARGFSPSGDLLAINNTAGQVYDTRTGETEDLFEGFGTIHFLRDDSDPPRTFTVGCGEMEVRILDPDGTVRTLAEGVVSCPAVAPHAPILLYQDEGGRLHRLDVSDGDDLLLDEILYSDGTTTFPSSGRNDLLILSSDGAVVVHHQRSWGGGRDWATLTRTTDGEVLGAIPDAQTRLDVVSIPGGHVMAITTGEHLWVLSQDYEFFAYQGLRIRGLLADRQLAVWDETYRQLFVFEPVTGFRSEAIYSEDPESETFSRPNVTVSANGRHLAFDVRERCGSDQCLKAYAYDLETEGLYPIFDDIGDASSRLVTDEGFVVMEGVFRRVAASVYERHVRVFRPDGALLHETSNRNLGQSIARGQSIYLQTFDPEFGNGRLERVDTASGEMTIVVDDMSNYRIAGDRLYYLTLPDEMGMTQLYATPLE